jgi:DNA-binding IclR family transcriptional regulator
MNSDQELRSLKRGLRVLALLNTNENLSISELARDLELPRTTTERILLTLVAEGYVHRVPDAARYRLSSRVCTLSGGFSDDCRVVQAATPLLRGLTERIGWPLAIATPRADRMVLRSTSDILVAATPPRGRRNTDALLVERACRLRLRLARRTAQFAQFAAQFVVPEQSSTGERSRTA